MPTEVTTTVPAAEPPVEITKNESVDQAEDSGTRRGEVRQCGQNQLASSESDDKSIASKSAFSCC